MAIRLVTGTPGSGKSFYCVKHLVDNYYSRVGGLYQLKQGYTVLSNLDNFRLDHLKLDEVIKRSGVGVDTFFTVDYQKKILEKYGKLVYVIDECQRYFDEYFRNKEVIYFFEYHRHLGFDIYLVSQSPNRICRAIRELAEVEIRAARRVVSFIGEMKYKVLVGGEQIESKVLKRDPEIFSLYKSMDAVESEKIKNPLVKWIAVAAVVLVLGILGFYFTFFGGPGSRNKKAPEVAASVPGAVDKGASAPVVVDRRLCSLDYAAVGDDVFAVDFETGQLVPLKYYGNDVVVKRKNGVVVGVYAYLSGSELEKFKLRHSPPATTGGGGERERGLVREGMPAQANLKPKVGMIGASK